jgi:hypothetical protein
LPKGANTYLHTGMLATKNFLAVRPFLANAFCFSWILATSLTSWRLHIA